jgi:coproporphyrinogen III oxidase-like Fe-S oxidoreductase
LNQQGARCILEFGIQTIHKNEQKLIDRFNNLKKADSVLHDCLSNGIEFEISLIYGLPNQTLESFIESVEWCLKRVQKKENLKAFPLMLLRGTPIHSRKEELGLIESTTLNEFLFEDEKKFYEGIPHVVSSPSFSKEDWIKMSQFMKNIK